MATPASIAPPFRRLRIYSFDPSLALRLQTAPIQELTIRLPWDCDPTTGRLEPGPIGEYVEVIDVDPASDAFYPPIDLNEPSLLAQDGLRPSEGNPQFHQQMAYAVAMATIRQFEHALGRVALWAPRRLSPGESPDGELEQFVQRLRIYPHALRDQNAYYSPDKKALLFGYFPVHSKDAHNTPGTTVFTCLSHDIIAHEVTHALLDGIHPRFNEPSNPDVHAFHEAFADIVALFSHFSYPSVLRDQIAYTRGDLRSESLLAKLAQQFGRAIGHRGALRDFLGEEVDGVWKPREPDPRALEVVTEPHARGAILVAAVFGAFVLLYRSRTKDLFRIATQGTGKLPEGDIHPDLANRLAEEASQASQLILQTCIRALDYCPPVDITFGTYLRALVTADVNFNSEDEFTRVALIESFREWGIYPRGTRSMSIEGLAWPSGAEVIADAWTEPQDKAEFVPSKDTVATAGRVSEFDIKDLFTTDQLDEGNDEEIAPGVSEPLRLSKWDLDSDRQEVWKNTALNRRALWRWLVLGKGRKYVDAFGLVLDDPKRMTIYRDRYGKPSVEVHSVRSALRRDARGAVMTDLIVEVTQRRRGYFDRAEQESFDRAKTPLTDDDRPDFKFRAGCTIVIDTTMGAFRHIIPTRGTVADDNELERARRFLTGDADASVNAFDGMRTRSLREPKLGRLSEPFALLHGGGLD